MIRSNDTTSSVWHRVKFSTAAISCAAILVSAIGTPSATVPERRMPSVDHPDSLFVLGLTHYDEDRPVDARWVFEQLARRLPRSSEWQAPAQLMLARTLYRLGDLQGAQEEALPLLSKSSPGTLPTAVEQRRERYEPHASYLLAMISWRNNDRRAAVDHAYRVVAHGRSSPSLAADARLLAQATIARADSAEFRGMDPVVQAFVRDAIKLNRAIGLYHGGQWMAARTTAQTLQRSSPNSFYTQEIAALISDIRSAERSEIRVGVIAPLSGPDSVAGAALLRGVEFALERQRTPIIGRPIVRQARSQLEAIAAAQEMMADPSIRAIIGPLTTENTIAAGAVAQCGQVPLISPTATGVGVSGIGDYVFQLNATPEAQGRLLAAVAIDSLKARTVATLSSVEPHERAMADAFADEVRLRGGEVFIQEWFFPNSADLRPQLSEIRLASLLSDTSISEDIRRRLALNLPTELDTMRLMREARTVDVLLVASNNPRDVINIAAQVPTQKIWARILGGPVWGEPRVRREAGEDAEGVIFTSGFDANAPESRAFVDSYRIARRENPSNITALAYDATSIVIDAITAGYRTRGQLRERIASTEGRPGASGTVTFSPDGANTESNIRLIRGGSIITPQAWDTLDVPSTWGVSVPAPEID